MRRIWISRVFLIGGYTELVYCFGDMLKDSKKYLCSIHNENLFIMKNQIIKFEKVAEFEVDIIKDFWKILESKIMEMED